MLPPLALGAAEGRPGPQPVAERLRHHVLDGATFLRRFGLETAVRALIVEQDRYALHSNLPVSCMQSMLYYRRSGQVTDTTRADRNLLHPWPAML